MPLTRNFRDTVRARAEREPAFRKALFQEAVQALLQGETDEGRAALRAYINATVGFERLAAGDTRLERLGVVQRRPGLLHGCRDPALSL